MLGVVVALGISHQALAGWEICNKTPDEMWVAIAYDRGDGVYYSEGWWKLAGCGGCKGMGNYALKQVWYRAESRGGSRVVEGDTLFCVHDTNSFKIDSHRTCGIGKRSQMVKRGFTAVTLTARNFTSNITGRSASGRVCID
jgi:uncharacterized membrane protein